MKAGEHKFITILGWAATTMTVVMYSSYMDQIHLNLSGQKGSVILPLTTTINCMLWATYGWLKARRDWPIIVANVPGILLGLVTLFTAF
ncbi:SWEET family sugar transporter [Oxalobacter sp. OttesenSCG-928-P03]|nr:SWEET family sugar transporter [Oxalobacter sp. OttesenSCG-928-P03]